MNNRTLSSLPKEERPRERLLSVGAENLSTTELLAIIISTGTHGSNVLDVAQELLSAYDGKLDLLFTADVQELSKLKGIGRAKAIQLKACFELSKRVHLSQFVKGDNYYFKSAEDIANYFMPLLRFQKQEYLMWRLSRHLVLQKILCCRRCSSLKQVLYLQIKNKPTFQLHIQK